MTPENRDNFVYIAGRYGQVVKFYNVEKICADKIKFLRENLSKVFSSRFSVGTFYRLMLDKKILQNENVSKIIYLDSDTIINLDIAELWNYPTADYTLAAVPEIQATHGNMIMNKYLLTGGVVKPENYFCAGIVMLNLDKLDENFFYRGVQWLKENPKAECYDQDILNYFFAGSYCKLPEKFDSFVATAKRLKQKILHKKIYHYAGMSFGLNMKDAYDKLFFEYFIKTPYFNLDFIEHTCQAIQQVCIEQKNFAVQVSALISGKERAFFVVPNEIDFAKKIFNINANEEIIIASSQASFNTLIEAMKNSNGKKIFFIMVSYQATSSILKQFGFTEGKDFINAVHFLSAAQGYPMSTQNLIKLL